MGAAAGPTAKSMASPPYSAISSNCWQGRSSTWDDPPIALLRQDAPIRNWGSACNACRQRSEPALLVTGGAGYIGSHTCKALADAGYGANHSRQSQYRSPLGGEMGTSP